jgi:hypothetical protein
MRNNGKSAARHTWETMANQQQDTHEKQWQISSKTRMRNNGKSAARHA